MKKVITAIAAASIFVSMNGFASVLISKDEAHHFKYEYVDNISVGASGGEISSPMDLHEKLSQLADQKGGKYYVIISAREHGPNFEAIAEVFK
ncbi:TPA: DUF1471 domain-containing protein [Raoultella planticola]